MQWPPEQELLVGNRRIFADRQHWPDGALAACEKIDRDHPGWYANWRTGSAFSGSPAGYYAHYRKPSGSWEGPVYGATPGALRAAIKAHPVAGPPPFQPIVINKDR